MNHKNLFLFGILGSVAVACGPSSKGDGDGGVGGDGGPVCAETSTTCDGNSFMTCTGGQWEVTSQCVGSLCDTQLGCVECIPGNNYCDGDNVYACNSDGTTGGLIETCSGGLHCSDGECVDLCAEAEENQSYIGCEYWSVDLDNAIDIVGESDQLFGCTLYAALMPGVQAMDNKEVCVTGTNAVAGLCDADGTCPVDHSCETKDVCGLDAELSPFAVVVSNPQDFPVNVTISNQSGQSQVMAVDARQVLSIFPQDLGFADQTVRGSGISAMAYRLVAEAPVVAYQFNPLNNVDVFSNDGSLLLPRHSFDTRYYAMTWPTIENRPNAKDYNGYLTVVAWQDGTRVTVTPTVDVRPGPVEPALPAGESREYTLNAFDVLNLEAAAAGDLTGSLIEGAGDTPQSFGVFAGHEAVAILAQNADCCADHIEEMMFPSSTWSDEYAIARSQARAGETDVLRIMAQVDGTSVTVTPSPGVTCSTLAAGEFCEVEIAADSEISSTEPIMVGHYLKSTISSLSGGSGDPSLALSVPVAQYRSTYTFLVPDQYESNYISVVAKVGVTITLDGTDIAPQFTPFGQNNRAAARIQVQAGRHTLNCTGGCGLEVYGYSEAVSYLFAGGLDLERLVVD